MTLARRLWTYQAERFPLAKTVPLLAVFSAASLNVSALLAGRPLPPLWAYAVAAGLAIILFFQLRVCDEVKDLEDDRRYRPERPIPRGLVSLRLIVGFGIGSAGVAALIAWAGGVFWLLVLVWVWLAVMTAEFGVPAWLKARPLVYLVSHMAIIPLIDLLLTGVEWARGGGAAPALVLFLALTFVNGCVLEIGRKIWAVEREGVETYSRLWGPERAALIWAGLVLVAWALLIVLGAALGHGRAFALAGGVGAALCAGAAFRFRQDRSLRWEKRLDAMAGIWVMICYATAGFLPLFLRWMA